MPPQDPAAPGAPAPFDHPRTPDPTVLAALRTHLRAHAAEYLADPNVTSVGIGLKVVDGERTDDVAVQFTVARKLPLTALESAGERPLPRAVTVDGITVPTDVLQRDYRPSARIVVEAASAQRRARVDPVLPGVSVAHVAESAGTIGAIVHDVATGRPLVLSNWHVLHGPGGSLGDVVVQPGPFDDPRTDRNRLGRLLRSHLGVEGDCAVATVEGRRTDAHVLELGVAPTSARDPQLGERVVKSGRSTAVTRGIVARTDVTVRLDYGPGREAVAIGGFEVAPDPAAPAADRQISAGGDSGSAWLFALPEGSATAATTEPVLAGLHFAGETDGPDHALACLGTSVLATLGVSLTPPPAPAEPDANDTGDAATAGTSGVVVGGVDGARGVDAPDGIGYAPRFLPAPSPVPAPALSAPAAADAPLVGGSPVLDYTHFSLAMSRSRRLARWVAWNVDGATIQKLPRSGLRFRRDPRLPDDAQWGDELYRDNAVDRGHLARRSDLLWGPRAQAQRANVDSFYFPNIAPQMDEFNQAGLGGLWGRLEDALYADVEVADLRISVFAGPVLGADDRPYRGALVPDEYWKAIAYVADGTLRARAFLLTQRLDRLETLELDEFATYQVPLALLEERTGVVFPPVLHDAERAGRGRHTAPSAERVVAPRRLDHVDDIDW